MKKWMVAVSVLALLVSGTAMLSYGQGPGPHKDFAGGHGPGMGMMLHELNLTDAQKAQVKTIIQANHANMKTVMQQMEQTRQAILTNSGSKYNQANIAQLATQQAALQAQIIANRVAVESQIYSTVLTADQQAKAEQMRTDAIARITQHLQKMANGTDTPPPPTE